MRRSALAVVLIACAALFATLTPGVAAPAAVSPVMTPPGDDPATDTGNLYVDPETFVEGQKVKITANFPSSYASREVTLFRKVSETEWTEVDTDESNSSGNAYFTDYQVDEDQELYARVTSGSTEGRTEVKLLEPTAPEEIGPDGTETGNLYQDPSIFTDGSTLEVTANFPSGVFDVTLYEKSGDLWSPVETRRSNRSGNAYFDYEVDGTSELFARKSNGERTEVDTLTPTVIEPESFPVLASSLTTNPTKVYDGRKATVNVNFPNGVYQVSLFKEVEGAWVSVGQAKSSSKGNASISNVQIDGETNLFALTDTGVRTEVTTITPAKPSDVSGGPKTLGHNVIYVTTDNGGTPKTKGVDYEGKAVLASGDTETDTWDLETIAVRGNSSADKPKKPYKLKFEDKQKPFGMKSDKTWILLANYGDWTLVRSMVAWDLGRLLDGLKWTPNSTFAELYLNGKYLGSYQMVESIKIDKNRVNVSKTTGQVIEFDPHWKEDGVPGMVGQTGVNYAWKDPDEFKEGEEEQEGLTTEKIAAMKQKIREFEDVLYGEDNQKDWSEIDYDTLAPEDDWQTYLDLNSAVDYYLAREFTKDNDADMYRSNFFYTDNVDPASPAKFFMGPIWDFDRSAGAKDEPGDTTISQPTGWWMRGNGSQNHDTNKIHWYTRITDDPRFLKALHDRWATKKAHFEAVGPHGVSAAVRKLGGSPEGGDVAYDLGKQVAANDRAVWKNFGGRYHAKTSSYTSELGWIRNWYSERYAWMDKELVKDPPPIP